MIEPTFTGYIATSYDALLVIQATLNETLKAVRTRPKDKERQEVIKSGNVFVFIEEKSHIKRWTDGVCWSPSRILGKFLLYREVIPTKVPLKSKKLKNSPVLPKYDAVSPNYIFKSDGLVKRTMTLTLSEGQDNQETIHLICYYSAEDTANGSLVRPSDTDLKDTQIDESLRRAWDEYSLGSKTPTNNTSSAIISSSNPVKVESHDAHEYKMEYPMEKFQPFRSSSLPVNTTGGFQQYPHYLPNFYPYQQHSFPQTQLHALQPMPQRLQMSPQLPPQQSLQPPSQYQYQTNYSGFTPPITQQPQFPQQQQQPQLLQQQPQPQQTPQLPQWQHQQQTNTSGLASGSNVNFWTPQ